MMNLHAIAARYGGKVSGNTVKLPTIGHPKDDRGTCITLKPDAPDGCLVHCFNGSEADALAVKERLRRDGFLPKFERSAPVHSLPDVSKLLDAAGSKISPNGDFTPASVWDYRDANGVVHYRKRRIDKPDGSKTFVVEYPDGNGGWVGGMGGSRHMLYRLPELTAHDGIIFAAEGERCADKLVHWGLEATSTKDLAKADLSALKGKTVMILPDNDDVGQKCAQEASEAIRGVGGNPVIVELPDLPKKGDVIDWSAGKTREDFLELLHQRLSSEDVSGKSEPTREWPEPVDLWSIFPPPKLPSGLLPPLIEKWASENAKAMGADVAGLAMAAIACCAAAIPDRVKLRVKRHSEWSESARIWVALVGPPSAKKSPAINAATAPIRSIDLDLFKQWQSDLKKWNDLEEEQKKASPKPQQMRLRLTDTTVEAAQQILECSPDGILMMQDELTAFFGSMDRYGSNGKGSSDRAFWLQAWNGGEYATNRVMRGSTLIPNLSVSLLGGIQPDPFRKIASDMSDDGLIQRLFPIMLQKPSLGSDQPMSSCAFDYTELVNSLHQIRGLAGLNDGFLRFSDAAHQIREDLERKNLELQHLETLNVKLSSHIGKYDGYFARLCVVWHCIEHYSDPLVRKEPYSLPVEIGVSTAKKVADFIHQFLLPHAVAFYSGCLGLSSDHDVLSNIAGFILSHGLSEVTNRDIQRGDRSMRRLRDFEVRPLLEQLEALGWLERVDGSRPKSKPHFMVNPRVHQVFEQQAQTETERRERTRALIQQVVGQ